MKKLGKHGGRLIIRNLPFSIEESVLRAILEKIGTLTELTIPMDLGKKRNKGFAFVEFEKKNISEKAIKALNGKKIQKREISIDYALSKDKYQSSLKSEQLSQEFKPQVHAAEEIQEEVEEEPEEVEEKAEQPKKQPAFDEGKVVFIMNLNFATEEEDLEEFFSDFGKVKYVKIVRNNETGESRGSGFVGFRNQEDVEKVIKISEEQGIELQERKLKIMKAVSKASAVNLKASKPPKEDKRNLHLTKLSLIPVDSDEFKSLTQKEIEMRTQAAKKIKEKLMNPNVFVSKTRLMFKNIPKVISDEDLKTLIKQILVHENPELENKKLFNQVKVLKETEKLDKQGNALSKGIAFVEFRKHEYALTAIKKCNSNASLFGIKHRPVVEFALEDHRILRIRKLKLLRQQKLKLEKSSSNEKKIGRGKRQRMKKQQAKLVTS